MLATIVGRNLTAHKLPSRKTRLSAPLGTTATAPSTEWDSQAAIRGRIDRVLIASMAETYARMDKSSADGMKTADAAVAVVVEGWLEAVGVGGEHWGCWVDVGLRCTGGVMCSCLRAGFAQICDLHM